MNDLSHRAAKALFNYQEFHESNTSVIERQTDVDESMMELRLHGNVIATFDHSHGLWITDAGWRTKVTSTRLNALHGVTLKGDTLTTPLLIIPNWDGEWMEIPLTSSYEVAL